MTSNLKLATWNLCLGIINKKDIVKKTILENKIDVCCMQEVEMPCGYPSDLMSFPGYVIEVENNDTKSRVAMLIKSNLKFTRKNNLDGTNSNIMIVDIIHSVTTRVINIYRSFAPQNNVKQREKFRYQLGLIKEAMTQNTIILGDFNIDDGKRFDVNYAYKNYFTDFDEILADFGLIQLVEFETWSRLVGNSLKSSILDHIYVTDVTRVSNITATKPCIGDHLLITFTISSTKQKLKETIKRDWRFYSKEKLCNKLKEVNWQLGVTDVQEYWNVFENLIINVVDSIAPLVPFIGNKVKANVTPSHIKNILNIRQRPLKKFKKSPNTALKARIVSLDTNIKLFYRSEKTSNVRKVIIPGNTQSLWKAVNIAKDQNCQVLPSPMLQFNFEIPPHKLPNTFAEFFENKIKNCLDQTSIKHDVYNGKRKIFISQNKMFMGPQEILQCMKTIKIKNCEGHDRIPQRILVDGVDHLMTPLTELFNLIYTLNQIPEQWLMAKVVPTHKKGNKNDINNYRPISNLCSTSKVFEKLILRRIMEIEAENATDLTGQEQHGFKKSKSTASAGLVIQSIISRALDENNYVVMASVDLTAAFDLVDVGLLVRRLRQIGMPEDVVRLIGLWLSNRTFYVSVDGVGSIVVSLPCGIVQGSILDPILYAIYVSPLFDITKLTNFADDNFVLRWNKHTEQLIFEMERELKVIMKWLKESGLKVNESKTEVCLFHRLDCQKITLHINNSPIESTEAMNVLGVTFDSKLNWSKHINNAIQKARKALHAIKLIKQHFTPQELRQIITSNFYSIIYYNSEIWHLPNLSNQLNQQLYAASATALKLCTPEYTWSMSYHELHAINKRATPPQLMKYKLSLQLYKLFNGCEPINDWLSLNHNLVLTRRQQFFEITSHSTYRMGSNFLSNRLQCLNKQIPLPWLNLPLSSFKLKCKNLFL